MKNIYIYPTKLERSWKIIFLLIFFSPLFWRGAGGEVFSQTAPGIEWQNTIGGSGFEQLLFMQQTADGGYILGGHSESNISGDKTENSNGELDYWIVKTDVTGNIQWQNTIGGDSSDYLVDVRQTADGGYILGGYSKANISGDKTEGCLGSWDYWIVKTDGSGNIQWQNTIGGNSDDFLFYINQTNDGGYIIGGLSESNISGDKTENCMGLRDYWLVKTDGSGSIQWQNTIGGNNDDYLYSVEQTTDGGYILGGSSASNISGDKTENSIGIYDYWLIKTDAAGTIQWQNTIGGSQNDVLLCVEQTVDGGYILGGWSNSNISGDKTENTNGLLDLWIVKTDASGNIQWQNTIGSASQDYFSYIRQTADQGFILSGYSYANISGDKTENCLGGWDYWVLKTDVYGNIQWQNTIGGSSSDYLYYLQPTADAGYILGGNSQSNISGDKTENCIGDYDYWIVKLFPDTITGISNFQLPISNFRFSPNPLTTQSKLTFKNHNKEKFLFSLYDITGRITQTVSTITNEIILTKGSKQPGVYLFNLMNEKTGERMNGKIVISD